MDNTLLPDLEHIASEESQQDWDRLEYSRIYRQAFIDGARYAEQEFLKDLVPKCEELETRLGFYRKLFIKISNRSKR